MTAALTTHDLSIGYSDRRSRQKVVANGLTLGLKSGEIVTVVGPNGVGKSTLLRTLAGLQAPLEGSVRVEDSDIRKLDAQSRAKRLGVVLTDRSDTGAMTAFEAVSLGRYPYTGWSGRLRGTDLDVIRWAIEAVDAAGLERRSMRELSDGERQKIMIGRALAQEPSIIILDEPTAFLDLPHRVEILRLLKELVRRSERAVLLSTHDLDLAMRVSDSMWLMDQKGNISVGAPEDLVLGSAFDRLFSTERIRFDPARGSFQISSDERGKVTVVGEGLALAWTIRALEREGFRTDSKGESLFVVRITEDDWTGVAHGPHFPNSKDNRDTRRADHPGLTWLLEESAMHATESGRGASTGRSTASGRSQVANRWRPEPHASGSGPDPVPESGQAPSKTRIPVAYPSLYELLCAIRNYR